MRYYEFNNKTRTASKHLDDIISSIHLINLSYLLKKAIRI
jgi:hypothetical protein